MRGSVVGALTDDGAADVFVHISSVERVGMRGLNDGQKITYKRRVMEALRLLNDRDAIPDDVRAALASGRRHQ